MDAPLFFDRLLINAALTGHVGSGTQVTGPPTSRLSKNAFGSLFRKDELRQSLVLLAFGEEQFLPVLANPGSNAFFNKLLVGS